MFNLSSYLEKFKNLKNTNPEKEIIRQVLLEETNIVLSEEEVIVSVEGIKIKGSSLQKNIIFLKKETLLKKIKELLPESNFKNIS